MTNGLARARRRLTPPPRAPRGAALVDTGTRVVPADDARTSPVTLYPVREQAALALVALGRDVRRAGDTFTVAP